MSNQYPGRGPSDDDNSAPQTSGNNWDYGRREPQYGSQNDPYACPSDPYEQHYGGPAYQQYPNQRGPVPGKGMAITALVLGIVAIVLCLIPFIGFVSMVGGLAAIVLGIIALVKKKPGKGMSIAGIILGALGMIIAILVTAATIAFIGTGVEAVSEERVVEYSATSSGDASVEYFDGDGDTTEQISGNWNEEVTFTGPPLSTLTVQAADASDSTAEVSCKVVVNGETVSENSASGAGATAICLGIDFGISEN